MLFTFLIPCAACFFALIVVFPSLQNEWPGPPWMASAIIRWLLIVFLGRAGWRLILEAHGTLALLTPVRIAAGLEGKPESSSTGETQAQSGTLASEP